MIKKFFCTTFLCSLHATLVPAAQPTSLPSSDSLTSRIVRACSLHSLPAKPTPLNYAGQAAGQLYFLNKQTIVQLYAQQAASFSGDMACGACALASAMALSDCKSEHILDVLSDQESYQWYLTQAKEAVIRLWVALGRYASPTVAGHIYDLSIGQLPIQQAEQLKDQVIRHWLVQKFVVFEDIPFSVESQREAGQIFNDYIATASKSVYTGRGLLTSDMQQLLNRERLEESILLGSDDGSRAQLFSRPIDNQYAIGHKLGVLPKLSIIRRGQGHYIVVLFERIAGKTGIVFVDNSIRDNFQVNEPYFRNWLAQLAQ